MVSFRVGECVLNIKLLTICSALYLFVWCMKLCIGISKEESRPESAVSNLRVLDTSRDQLGDISTDPGSEPEVSKNITIMSALVTMFTTLKDVSVRTLNCTNGRCRTGQRCLRVCSQCCLFHSRTSRHRGGWTWQGRVAGMCVRPAI